MMMTFSSASTPSTSARSWGTIVVSTSEDTPAPRMRKRDSISSKNTITGTPPRARSPGPGEDDPDLAFGLPHELVEQLGALDVEEVRLPLRTADGAGQRRGNGAGDQGLAAAGRAVEQHALRGPQPVLAVQLRVEERQLDGVADLLDLRLEPADVAVVGVRLLLEDQVLDLGALHELGGEAGADVDDDGVAHP